MKICRTCGREKHKGLCDMATLSDGRTVHVSRISYGGDLHNQIGEGLKIKNRWRKPNQLKDKKEQNDNSS